MIRLLLLCLTAFTVLAACTAAPKPPVESRPPTPDVSDQRAVMQERIAAGDYLEVLKLIDRRLRAGESTSDFASVYPEAVNGLLRQARRDQKQARLAPAGRRFRQALGFYPEEASLRARIEMSAAQIDQALVSCRDALMERGLAFYRDGRLSEAIDLWKGILTFSPSHQPAVQAIRTAEIQRRNLEEIDEKGTDASSRKAR